jgi:hypothetical protein
MKRSALLLLLLLLGLSTSLQGAPPEKPVVLHGRSTLRSGTVLREKREVLVSSGTMTVQAAAKQVLGMRWMQRHSLVRRIQGSSAEEIEVRDHSVEAARFAPGGPQPGSAIQPGPLMGKKLLARRLTSGWDFRLAEGKPTVEQNDALLKLAFFSSILEIIPAALGTQSRRPGESWKPNLPMPRGKANGIAIFKDVEVGFGSIEQRPDGPHAHVFISGSFTMQRPLGYLASAQATFGIAITRRLSDLVDVETTIKGIFKDEATIRLEGGASGSLAHDFPYVVTRSIEIER